MVIARYLLTGESAIFVSTRASDAYILSTLLIHRANPTSMDEEGRTPLVLAAKLGISNAMKILEELGGSDRGNVTDSNSIALLRAAYYGHRKGCQLILERDGDCTYKSTHNST